MWQKYFACGEPVGLTVHTRPDAAGLVLAADDDLSVTLGVAGDASVSATVPVAGTFALVGEDGDIVGYLYPDEDAQTTVHLDAAQGDTTRLDDGVHLIACDDTEIPDRVTAWPFVQATIVETSADDKSERAVVAVADARTLDLAPYRADDVSGSAFDPVTIISSEVGWSANQNGEPVVDLAARTVTLRTGGSTSCPYLPKRIRIEGDVIQIVTGVAEGDACTLDVKSFTYVVAIPEEFSPRGEPTVEVFSDRDTA
ncbi:hypothetical protein KIN34_07675 [Cellulomonas sp. DKR-3]|uniref:Uncharacterized protein n=1 Tax=Cellulomonas fulva TaxID=2835530 RepID=A0ABS5TYG3_9CELL|nr:hypothetical protein [Cellulomonas fulva]MBT0994162.1 hypothetical protein [Cellulomonas fulva]